VAGDFIPGAALIYTCVNRAGICAEVYARLILGVACHGLSEHCEETILLGQAGAGRLPTGAAIARAPDGGARLRRVATDAIAIERKRPNLVGIFRVDVDRKAKCRRQALGDVIPTATTIPTAPNSMVILLIEKVILTVRTDHVMHTMTYLPLRLCLRMVMACT